MDIQDPNRVLWPPHERIMINFVMKATYDDEICRKSDKIKSLK